MKIDIGGVHLFFDAEGAKLAPDGPDMRERPTLVLLHAGRASITPILGRRIQS